MPTDTPPITERDQEIINALTLIATAVHQISHDLHRVVTLIEPHAPLLDAYQRGGLLGLRTARKNGRASG